MPYEKTLGERPGKIIGVGLNYVDHVREARLAIPTEPFVFAKLPTALIGDGDAIEFDPAVTERVDWEVELAVVVGKRMRGVDAEQAREHVRGYTVANDVSARDLQATTELVLAKGLDSFCPLGPRLVPAAEVEDPAQLRMRTRVNGETMQDSTTAQMIFGVFELLAHCSRLFTWEPGDVLLTGTPAGCGEFMDPPLSLHDGDIVEVEIEGIGTLRNPVVEAGS
jgi:2-keto-4-pentenoate hydratase/2-oxohepta-3-ene-1,7-dioic acid hydratase in catechol pathway